MGVAVGGLVCNVVTTVLASLFTTGGRFAFVHFYFVNFFLSFSIKLCQTVLESS